MRSIYYTILLCFSVTFFAETAELKIAVVDEQLLLDEYDKSAILIKMLEEQFKKEEAKMMDLEKKIVDAKKDAGLYEGEKRYQIINQMRRYEIEYKINKEYLTEILAAQRAEYTKEVLTDIEKAIDKYCKDNNFDLVLKKPSKHPKRTTKTSMV